MKRKLILAVLLIMTVFLSAEQFKGIFCFNLHDTKSNVKKMAEDNGFILHEVNSNYYEIKDIINKTYATRNVRQINLAFWNDRLVWIELYLGVGQSYDDVSGKDEILSAICEKYNFTKDYKNSKFGYYTNYINIDSNITFNFETTSLSNSSNDIEMRFCYLNEFLQYKKWRNEIESIDRKKALNDSI